MWRQLSLLFLLTNACATAARYEYMLDGWRGQDVGHLLETWGEPTRTYNVPDGTVAYEFEQDGGVWAYTYVSGGYPYTTTGHNWCRTTFYAVDKKITLWKYFGTACRM